MHCFGEVYTLVNYIGIYILVDTNHSMYKKKQVFKKEEDLLN